MATCCKWHVGHGLVPRIAKQRNANECQRHVTRWEQREVCATWEKIFFFCRAAFFCIPPPPPSGVSAPKKNLLPGLTPPPQVLKAPDTPWAPKENFVHFAAQHYA